MIISALSAISSNQLDVKVCGLGSSKIKLNDLCCLCHPSTLLRSQDDEHWGNKEFANMFK